MTFKYSILIEAPVEQVFGFFRDPGNWYELAGKGSPALYDIQLSDAGVGTSYRWAARLAFFKLEGANRFTRFIPNDLIRDESSCSIEGTWTYRFEPEGTGTRVTIENEQTSFWRVPPLRQLMEYLAGQGHKPMLAALKARFEQPSQG